MNLKDIQSLIKFVAKSGVNEVKLEMKDIKINIRNTAKEKTIVQQSTPVQQIAAPTATQNTTTAPASTTTDTTSDDDKYLTITSPIIGTFYRKPSPDKPTFINVGDTVQEDSIVCIVEAMKLFNEIESEVSGKIVKVLVEDSTPVEFGQPLFLVDPS
ncbi:MAG TPA: acetyl-CoA carboxylase biotin carboxyl carrier protein [Lutibacter sp.]|nr:acetyl-CoA carboxylase biotin carboxyl carrier protein [Lutibacter sp.]